MRGPRARSLQAFPNLMTLLFQLPSDGRKAYLEAVECAFGAKKTPAMLPPPGSCTRAHTHAHGRLGSGGQGCARQL